MARQRVAARVGTLAAILVSVASPCLAALAAQPPEVIGKGTIRIRAGTFTAWKVAVRAPAPGGHVLTVRIDTRSRQVLRYDGGTRGPGAWWTLTLEP